jgi:hypothetical protein
MHRSLRRDWRDLLHFMDDQQKQRIIDLPKIVAGAIATPLAALLTSRFGIAGTMVGLALSAVIITVIVDTLKVYLARVPEAVTSIPGGLKKKSAWGGFLDRLRLPFSKLSTLPPPRRRSILIRSLIGGVIMFIIGLIIVTGVEASVGKNLSCWAWDDCYTESSSADAENASGASGQPSIIIAGDGISASAPEVGSSVPQQQPAPTPPVAPTPPASPSASGKGSQPSVSQRPSAPPSEQQSSSSTGYEQQSEYQEPQGEYQQQSEYSQQDEYQQQSVTSDSESERQSFSSSSETQLPSGSQQRSPTPTEGADEAGWSW